MRRADYTYEVGKYKNKVDVITIKDLNLGMDNWYDAIEVWISRKTEL